MSTRTVKDMISEVRDNTNNNGKSRFTDIMLMRFFDSASRHIQMTVYNAYPQDPVFYNFQDYTVEPNQTAFQLPSNMLGPHTIYSIVPLRLDGSKSDPLHRLSLQEVSTEYGYLLRGRFFEISLTSLVGLSSISKIRINYAKKWDRIDSVDSTPEIPEILEEFMTMYVERKINYVDSSADILNSNIFTSEERAAMVALYADMARDPKQVPTGQDTYISY